ncbi:MAG: alpha/beta hydrolase [Pyrinomonadaceae bacterium]|nr:alpha/beta hydrolase [Pyrinomonadaceae bacterium]
MKKLAFLFVLIIAASCKTSEVTPTGTSTQAPGKPVDEKSFVKLGGEEQYVEISSDSDKNPVLLFIHGGPGWPQTPQIRAFNSDISKDYTLVVWEQRGAGQSYVKNPNPENVTLKQIVADAKELTEQLKKRFGQEKIYLAGYSWGSVVGMELAQNYPEDYRAYISIAQVINKNRGMEVSQEWLRKKAEENNDKESLAILEKLKNPTKDFCDGRTACFMKQYELITKYGGAVYDKEIGKKIEEKTDKYEDYKDYPWMKAYEFSAPKLEEDLYAVDIRDVKELKIPVYFFVGRHDNNVPAILVDEFAKGLKAPKKEVIWFEKAGHAIMEEEPEKFNKLIVERVLNR